MRALAIESGKSCEDESVISHFQHNLKEPVKSWLKIQCGPASYTPFDQMLELAENIEKTTQESEGLFFFGAPSKAHAEPEQPKSHKATQQATSGPDSSTWVRQERREIREPAKPAPAFRSPPVPQGGRALPPNRVHDRSGRHDIKPPAGKYHKNGPHDYSGEGEPSPTPMDIGATRAAVVSRPFYGSSSRVAASTPPATTFPGDNRPKPEPSIMDHMQVTMKGSDWLHSLSDHHQREIMKRVSFYQDDYRLEQPAPAAVKPAKEIPKPPAGRTVPVAWPKKIPAPASKLPTAPKLIPPEPRLIGPEVAVVPAMDIPRVNYSQTTMMEMASAFDLLECPVSFGDSRYTVVIDTGSSLNLMSYRQVYRFGMREDVHPSKLYFKVADGGVSEARGELRNVPLTFESLTFLITFAVLDECCHDLLLGTSFLQETLGQIEFGKERATLKLTNGKERVEVPVTCLRKKPSLRAREVEDGESHSASAGPRPLPSHGDRGHCSSPLQHGAGFQALCAPVWSDVHGWDFRLLLRGLLFGAGD